MERLRLLWCVYVGSVLGIVIGKGNKRSSKGRKAAAAAKAHNGRPARKKQRKTLAKPLPCL
jgi:hypothetical protein